MAKYQKKPDKPKPKTPEEELREAKSAIRFLESCPKDFRDMPPYSSVWDRYAKLLGPGKTHEMTAWLKGPIVISVAIEDLDQREQFCFKGHKLLCIPAPLSVEDGYAIDWHRFVSIVDWAAIVNASYIYMRELPLGAVQGINQVLSYTGHPIRFKPRIESTFAHPGGGKQHDDNNRG